MFEAADEMEKTLKEIKGFFGDYINMETQKSVNDLKQYKFDILKNLQYSFKDMKMSLY